MIGSVRYAVVVTPFDGTLATRRPRLQAKITGEPGYQVIGGEQAIRTTCTACPASRARTRSPGPGRPLRGVRRDGLDAEVTVAGNGVELRDVMPVVQASIVTLASASGPR